MSWSRSRSALASILVTTVFLASSAPAASAAAGTRFHFAFDVSVPESWCDFPSLIGHHVGVETEWIRSGPGGVPLFTFVGNDTHTITNPANGRSIVWFDAGRESDISAIWTGADTYRVTTFFDGNAERLTLPDGTHLSADVGRIVFYNDFSDAGTPGDFSDDFTIDAGGITFEAGPHPDGDADGAVLCSILDTYLR